MIKRICAVRRGAAVLLIAVTSVLSPSYSAALVIPGTPEYEPRKQEVPNLEPPSVERKVRVRYRAFAETAQKPRRVRMSYSKTEKYVRKESSRSQRNGYGSRLRKSDNGPYAASPPSRTISYNHPTHASRNRTGGTCLRIPGRSDTGAPSSRSMYGTASWYGWDFHGRNTSNGETYNMYERTAAHRTLPFDTVVRVTNLSNGRQSVVRINDRGPFVRGRDIDLSYGAARDLGMLETGVEKVRLEILSG